jgi:hypothetical protein
VYLQTESGNPGRLGLQLEEETGDRYEGQMGSSGICGLGVLVKKRGGSFAGQVSHCLSGFEQSGGVWGKPLAGKERWLGTARHRSWAMVESFINVNVNWGFLLLPLS